MAAPREYGRVARPRREHLLPTPGVPPYAERRAHMVEDDGRLREGAGRIRQLVHLRAPDQRVEAQPGRLQGGEIFPEGRLRQQAPGCAAAHEYQDGLVLAPVGGLAFVRACARRPEGQRCDAGGHHHSSHGAYRQAAC